MNGGQGPYKKHVDFSEPVNLTTNEDDKPWWTASNGDETLFSGNYPLQKHDIAELMKNTQRQQDFLKNWSLIRVRNWSVKWQFVAS